MNMLVQRFRILVRVPMVAALSLGATSIANAQLTPDPLYHYQFTSDYSNSGTSSGGTFTTINAIGPKPTEIKITDHVLDLTGNTNRSDPYSSRWLSSENNNVGTLNQFTVTFWVKSTDLNGYQTVFAAGTDPSFTRYSTNQFSIRLVSGKIQATINGPTSLSATTLFNAEAALTSGEWTFIAVSYDGTSSLRSNSTAQEAATGDSSNLQLYRGDESSESSISRSGIGFGTVDNAAASPGTIALGSTSTFYVGSITDETTIFNGELSDLRVYDSILTPTQVNEIRLSNIPEPSSSTAVLSVLVALGFVVFRRKRSLR
ncbi:MAG: LamG domain-containing protein [Verrucomicrobiota bacterium JB024]|nr:LamG domain-containing protein [Verrucomicrobiota bacterium JB024]